MSSMNAFANLADLATCGTNMVACTTANKACSSESAALPITVSLSEACQRTCEPSAQPDEYEHASVRDTRPTSLFAPTVRPTKFCSREGLSTNPFLMACLATAVMCRNLSVPFHLPRLGIAPKLLEIWPTSPNVVESGPTLADSRPHISEICFRRPSPPQTLRRSRATPQIGPPAGIPGADPLALPALSG